MAVVAQSEGKKKEKPTFGMMEILGVTTAMKGILKHNPKRNKLEYVEMSIG